MSNVTIDNASEPDSWEQALASPSCQIRVEDHNISTFDRLASLICRELRITDASLVTEDVTFAHLGATSLDRIHLAALIEERFNIELPDPVVENIETVGDALASIELRIGK